MVCLLHILWPEGRRGYAAGSLAGTPAGSLCARSSGWLSSSPDPSSRPGTGCPSKQGSEQRRPVLQAALRPSEKFNLSTHMKMREKVWETCNINDNRQVYVKHQGCLGSRISHYVSVSWWSVSCSFLIFYNKNSKSVNQRSMIVSFPIW